jgi:hypothetical protein
MLLGCSSKDKERYDYTFKGENEFWSAELRINGYIEFYEEEGTLKVDSYHDQELITTYKKDLSDLSTIKHIEIGYDGGVSSGKMVGDYPDETLNSKTFTMKSGGNGATIREDEIIKVTINIDGEIQTFDLVTDSFKENNPDVMDEIKWEHASEGLNELNKVWIETEYETYKNGSTDIRVKWYSSLEENITFGNRFLLEKKVGRFWKVVSKETDIDYGFNDEGFILNSNETRWHTYNLIPYTDGLSTGEYRISTTFFIKQPDGNYLVENNQYQIYGYFKVEEEDKK